VGSKIEGVAKGFWPGQRAESLLAIRTGRLSNKWLFGRKEVIVLIPNASTYALEFGRTGVGDWMANGIDCRQKHCGECNNEVEPTPWACGIEAGSSIRTIWVWIGFVTSVGLACEFVRFERP
jgi:hypothetical protein